MSRDHNSAPLKSNALRMPVPVMAKTPVPSVTGEGDDMFCLRSLWLPPPSTAFHRTAGPLRSTHQSDSESPSATLRKMSSPQTIGVEPLNAGSGSFHATLFSALHVTGSPVSAAVPFSCGPRHCGQLSADTAAPARTPNENASHARLRSVEVSMDLSYRGQMGWVGTGAFAAIPL